MDLQGTPISHSSRGTKVTNDPRSQQPIEEPSGPITNDSLAAQSIRQGGGFSGNRGAEPMGVSGNQSTVKNTDTSASTKLPSASSSAQRQDRHEEQKYPECVVGQGNFPGTHMDNSGYAGGSTAAKREMGIKAGEYSTASGSSRGTQHNAGGIQEGDLPPDDAKNASFASEIGSSEDPGRGAINQFQRNNAHSVNDTGRVQQKGVDAQNLYEQLESDQRA
ncbi:uncharacterized protein N7479_008847 [Penicillium vulpinum]|uniref:Uncharacterized protein n=1 Tax=Penicillium vulpinum TaxID=29845 RepID=A0A1V6S2B6_9EURO|nr:uncharacterized protein N7479_008847 [Penicillium vulpinum]KAJ5950434.1 hypothetical protein N7479_008847 [Penicillium vulpinum]OQE07884.1 hypothetical protein PENVUL_c012G01993 [Penicillium vulpinum]